ncbi:MAG TPA: hypothetical protein VLY21_00625 [Nitrososphaerales archaeon]|nr:hypothetical protein [Nitrososphaerales archaeon]HUK75279.1 hypothetical protein [Nitrososphaerales archaeon]
MPIGTTMTGSWFRTAEILKLLPAAPRGEIPQEHRAVIEAAERRAVRDQLHPNGSPMGLSWVSNGEQRKAGYTQYLPNRYSGFSKTEVAPMPFPPRLLEEFLESNPQMGALMQTQAGAKAFSLAKIVDRLEYLGADAAVAEARDAARLAKEEGAKRIFVPSASPGVVTLFFANNPAVYRTHLDYLSDVSKQQRAEYRAILSVDGVDLQIDAPDLAMGKQTAGDWDIDFYDALRHHVDAINDAIAGLPAERIRVHYCYGNWLGSHRFDADFSKVLAEVTRLKVGLLVGEFANPRHEGDFIALQQHVKEHGWPRGLRFAIGVLDVKTPFVESPETVALRLERGAQIIGAENVLGGSDCGFETFANFGNVPYKVGLLKLESMARGADLAGRRLGGA